MTKPPENEPKAAVKQRRQAMAAIVATIAVGGTVGIAFTIWLLGKCAPWPAYCVLCGVFALSTLRMFRSFEIFLFVGISCFLGAMIVGMPNIPRFGHYGLGAFAGIFTAAMIVYELVTWFEKRRSSDAHAQRRQEV